LMQSTVASVKGVAIADCSKPVARSDPRHRTRRSATRRLRIDSRSPRPTDPSRPI
jgi:hypothetical protein